MLRVTHTPPGPDRRPSEPHGTLIIEASRPGQEKPTSGSGLRLTDRTGLGSRGRASPEPLPIALRPGAVIPRSKRATVPRASTRRPRIRRVPKRNHADWATSNRNGTRTGDVDGGHLDGITPRRGAVVEGFEKLEATPFLDTTRAVVTRAEQGSSTSRTMHPERHRTQQRPRK